jgi:hypothetical protein
MTTELSQKDIADRYARIAQGIGEVSMAFSRLDEILMELFILLVDPDKREFGHIIYDSQHSHGSKIQLLQVLLRGAYGLLGPMLKLAKRDHGLPDEYKRLDDLLKAIEKIAKERNRVVHDVYTCWIGKQGPHFDRRTLRGGHDNMVVVQDDAICPVTYDNLHSLAKRISELRSKMLDEMAANQRLERTRLRRAARP